MAETGPIEQARQAFLRSFRWTDGHADFSRVLAEGSTLDLLGQALAEPFRDSDITAVVAPEAKGFVLGALCARELHVGIVLARKPGSLHPGSNLEVTSRPDWRGRRINFRLSAILGPCDRVLLVDDWIETGAQLTSIQQMVEQTEAVLVGASVVVDDTKHRTDVPFDMCRLVTSDDF